MRRLRRFWTGLAALRRLHLLSRHNVRAIWIQADPTWTPRWDGPPLTDEEIEAFIEACGPLQADPEPPNPQAMH